MLAAHYCSVLLLVVAYIFYSLDLWNPIHNLIFVPAKYHPSKFAVALISHEHFCSWFCCQRFLSPLQ